MNGHKFDHPPLLAPGRHVMTLTEVEALCVHRFSGPSLSKRDRLFYLTSQKRRCTLNLRVNP
jgi:hypothetical protein